MHTSEDDDFDFIDEDLITEEPPPPHKKKRNGPSAKAYKRRIIRGQLKEDWATAGPFKKGGFNGEYKNLKFGNDPNKQAKLYNKSSPNGSPITRAIKNKLKGGRAMGHCTASCNPNNKPGNPEEFYDGDLHGDLDGGILAHGLNPFCTVQGHKPDSHINGVWLVALARLLMGIQHVHKTHKQDLDKSNGWIAIIVYFEDDPEFDKIRKFPEGCQWAKILMQPGYSLEPMAVSEEQHILLVHIDNIPDFFMEIAGHPRLIPPRTLEQKKETRQKWYHEGGGKEAQQKWYQKWFHEGGGKEAQQKWYHEGGGKETRQKYYHEGGGKETRQRYNEGRGKEVRQRYNEGRGKEVRQRYNEGRGKETRQRYNEGRGKEVRQKWYNEGGGKECHHQWYYKGGGKEYKQQYNQQRKLTATEKSFNKFSTSGVLPESLQCDCGKKYNIDSLFQNHIAACPHIKKGLRSSQQLLIKSLGMSATSCKDHRIRWLKLKSELKAMHLPPSDLDVNSFIKKDQQPRVNSFVKEQQQERVDRLKKMIECEKMRKESAQDKASIANIEIVLAEIELQQENKENSPKLVFDDIPDDGYNYKKIEEGPDVLLVSDKYLRKVLRKNNLPTDGIRTTLLNRVYDHNKQKKPHNYENY